MYTFDWCNQWHVLDYMCHFEETSNWAQSGIHRSGMPQPRPDTKRFNVRDHARASRHQRAVKETDLGLYEKPYIWPARVTQQQINKALHALSKT